jgi:predicted GIY-YIG superfamily endonuclease
MAYRRLTAKVNTGEIGFVYLLHFDTGFGHARHYTGWAAELAARLNHHASGSGARLLYHVRAAGIGWSLARTWSGVDRNFERLLKNRGGAARRCPICLGQATPALLPHYGPLPAPIVALAA